MKKVLIVNRGCCDNLGDQAINIAMKKFLISNYNVVTSFSDYTSLSDEPRNIDLNLTKISLKMYFRELVKLILPLKLIWLIRNFSRLKRSVKNDIDLIVIGGGQLILSNTTFDIAAATWVFFAKLNNIPIVFCSVGCGTKYNYINKILFSYALRNSNGICVRDQKSKYIVESEFFIKADVSGDIVFTESIHLSQSDELMLLGIPALSVYNTYNSQVLRQEYYNIWLNFLSENNIDVKKCILFYTTSEDYIESVGFKAYLHSEGICNISISHANSLGTLESLFTKTGVVISGRMHGLIVALNYNCKALVFPISGKLSVFKETVESQHFNLSHFKLDISQKTISFFDKWI